MTHMDTKKGVAGQQFHRINFHDKHNIRKIHKNLAPQNNPIYNTIDNIMLYSTGIISLDGYYSLQYTENNAYITLHHNASY